MVRSRAEGRECATAIHEAGHAIAALALGRRFRHVTIVPTNDTLGHVRFLRFKPPDQQRIDLLIISAEISLAGYLAEREFGFRPRRVGWEADREAAMESILYFAAGDEVEAKLLIRVAERRVTRLIARWRERIDALAAQLVDRRKMSFIEVRETCAQLANGPRPYQLVETALHKQ